MKKPIYKKWWFWLLVVLVVGAIGNIGAEEEQAQPKDEPAVATPEKKAEAPEKVEPETPEENKKVEEPKIEEPKTPKEIIEPVATKSFSKVNEVSYNKESGALSIKAIGKDNLSNSWIKDGIMIGIVDTAEQTSKLNDVNSLEFDILLPLVDQYGNEKDGSVVKVTLNKETLQKINFDNFKIDNLKNIADSYWEHPALSK